MKEMIVVQPNGEIECTSTCSTGYAYPEGYVLASPVWNYRYISIGYLIKDGRYISYWAEAKDHDLTDEQKTVLLVLGL